MSDYSELERRAQAAIDAIGTLSRARQEREFNDVCTPQVVKDLIADLDEARSGMKYSCAIRLKKQIEHLEGERDQLRAEVAGLKTGYEAYERVNAELKAENEALRVAGAGALRFIAFAFDEGVEGAEMAGRAIENAIGAKS